MSALLAALQADKEKKEKDLQARRSGTTETSRKILEIENELVKLREENSKLKKRRK